MIQPWYDYVILATLWLSMIPFFAAVAIVIDVTILQRFEKKGDEPLGWSPQQPSQEVRTARLRDNSNRRKLK